MATLAEEYEDLYDAKKEIADAITDVGEKYGIKANEADSFRSYADKILKIGNSIWSSAEDSEEQHLLITENGYYDVNDLSKRYFDDADKYSAVSSLWISVQSAPIVTGEGWIIEKSTKVSESIPASIPHQNYSNLTDLCTYFGGENGLVPLFGDWYLNTNIGAIQWVVNGVTRFSNSIVVNGNDAAPPGLSIKTSGIAVKYEESGAKCFSIVREERSDGCIGVIVFPNEKVIMPFSHRDALENVWGWPAIIATESGFTVGEITKYANFFRSKIAILNSSSPTIPCESNNLYVGPYLYYHSASTEADYGPKTIECDGKTLTNISGPIWIAS